MCIEFVIQVLKRKNAHVSFPVGMVVFGGSHSRRQIQGEEHPSVASVGFCRLLWFPSRISVRLSLRPECISALVGRSSHSSLRRDFSPMPSMLHRFSVHFMLIKQESSKSRFEGSGKFPAFSKDIRQKAQVSIFRTGELVDGMWWFNIAVRWNPGLQSLLNDRWRYLG